MGEQLPSIELLNRESLTVAEERASYAAIERGFKGLVVWQIGMDLMEAVYDVSRRFPKDEMFGLTSQIRRAATSVSLNIAEGYARNGRREFARFLDISMGSAAEVEAGLEVAARLKYVNRDELTQALELLDKLQRMIFKLKAKIAAPFP